MTPIINVIFSLLLFLSFFHPTNSLHGWRREADGRRASNIVRPSFQLEIGSTFHNSKNVAYRHRYKRQVKSTPQTLVFSNNLPANSALFTVASGLGDERDAEYQIKNNTLVGLSLSKREVITQNGLLQIDPKTGVVWNLEDLSALPFHTIELTIDVLRNEKPDSFHPITIKLLPSGWDDVVFTNQPIPIWATIGVWNRPFEPIISLQSVASFTHSAHDVRYFIEYGNTEVFAVDEVTGGLSIISRQQFVLDDLYTLVVSAQSHATRKAARVAIAGNLGISRLPIAAQAVNVKVGSKPPQFHASPFVVNFFENATAGQRIGKVEATSFQKLPLTFSSPISSLFSLDPSSGHVTLNSELTYIKDVRQYEYDVKVTEEFSNFESTTKLIMKLHSTNHPPTFPVPFYVKYSVPEDIRLNSQLLELVVRDYDPGDQGRLEVVSDEKTFKVEEADGTIKLSVARPLNYEVLPLRRYDFKVRAIDHGWPRLTGTTNVQIFVDNRNNKAPVLWPQKQVVTLQEGARKGLVVHHIQAYDPDGDNIRFRFNADASTRDHFKVDENTGAITLLKSIDPKDNKLTFFNLSISITDDSSCCPNQPSTTHTTQGYIGINVYRVNTQPTFPFCPQYKPSVEENSEGTTEPILTLEASDADTGLSGQLSFSIFAEETSNFRVQPQQPNSKKVDLYLTQKISRDSPDVLKFNDTFKYPVVVKAVDQGTPALSVNCFLLVTIQTINLNVPRFDYSQQNAYFYAPSASPGAKVVRVFAFDTDFGMDGEVSYSFLNSSETDHSFCISLFKLDVTTGWITWKGAPVALPRRVRCKVQAQDNGTPKRSSHSTVNIQLTNNTLLQPPSWQKVSNNDIDNLVFSIKENTEVNTGVINLTATIPYNSSIEFFLPTNNLKVFNGKGIFGSKFMSSGRGGQMTVVVKKSIPEANLQPFFYLRCRAFVKSIGSSIPTLIASISRLRVNIEDVNNQVPMFLSMNSNGIYTAAVTRFTKAGDFVVLVTAVDMDQSWPNNKVTYSIQAGEGSELFSMDADTGVMRVKSPSSPSPGTPIFNPSKKAFYEIVVMAQDGAPSALPNVDGPNKVSIKVQVTVNGGRSSSPSFDRTFSTSISEVLPRFSKLLNATASLPSNLPVGNTALSQYNIRGGNVGRVFAVDINNGTIYNVGALDADKISFYSLKYTVFDGLRVIGPVDVNITVTRSNFRPVIFDASEYNYNGPAITEKDSRSIGTTLARVSTKATNNNQRTTYSVSEPSKFSVDSSGVVKMNQALSRDVPDGFAPQQVNVKADAGGYSPGYAVVTVPLEDINDNKPLLDPCCTSGFVNENTVSNAFQLKSFDADAGLNREVSYSLVGNSENFELSPTGWVSTKKALNFEEKQKYTLKVKVTDKGAPPLSSESDISVFVKDVSEFAPSFESSEYQASIDEELPLGAHVTSLLASDRDPMDNLTYSLLSSGGSQDHENFYVEDSRVFDGSYEDNNARMISSGVVKIRKRIDFDLSKKALYEFVVQVTDTSGRQANTLVKVTVKDVNDNAPSVSPPSTSLALTANDAAGKSVAQFRARDIDSGVNGQFSFSIDHQNTDPMFHFRMNPTTGQVTIQNPFTPLTPSSMLVTILAVDKGTPPLVGRAHLNVSIRGLLRAPPAAPLPQYPIVLKPNAAKNSQVYCLNNNNNNNYKYQLDCKGVEHCDDFTINQQGCLLANRNGYNRKELDYNNYNIPVLVSNRNGNNNPDLVTRQNVRLVMQGTTDTAPQAGSKQVHVVNYVDEDGGYPQLPLGNAYATDVDDWDLHLKSFKLVKGAPYFQLKEDHKGKVFLRGDVTEGSHVAEVEVKDGSFSAAVAKVMAEVNIVNKTALDNAASMRLSGLTGASDLLRKPPKGDKMRLEVIKETMEAALGEGAEVVVLSIGDFKVLPDDAGNAGGNNRLVARQVQKTTTNNQPLVDVLYAAKSKSKFYSPQLLNNLAHAKKAELQSKAAMGLLMAPVDMCRSEFYSCWVGGCLTEAANLRNQPRLINTNETSFMGMSVDFQQKCAGMPPLQSSVQEDGVVLCVPGYCLNQGRCVVNNTAVKCLCPPAFNGQRCEKTLVSFVDQGGYLLLPPLPQSQSFHLGLEILIPTSSPSTTLILYSGPQQTPTQDVFEISNFYENQAKQFVSKDFLLLELVGGKPRLRVDLGDGEVKVELQGPGVKSLVDGKWHALDVRIEDQNISLTIDDCRSAQISETIASSSMDTASCKTTSTRTGSRFLVSTGSFPLQLGGRTDTTTAYPANWVKEKLRGCVRNLMVNSMLYDLHVDEHKSFQAAEGTCRYEDCSSCPSNASCQVIGPPGSVLCQCPPGFQGNNCQTPTASRYYSSNEFVQWKPTSAFSRQANTSQNFYADSFQLMFRTRQQNGVLFSVKSFTDLERYLLELEDGHITFKYDLGSNDQTIRLDAVKVNDGSWHWVNAKRHGNQVELRLDESQGAKYNSTFPTNKHRYIKLFSANILGELSHNQWSKQTTVDKNLEKSCVSDVRYNGNQLSLTTSGSLFEVESRGGTDDGCEKSGACVNVNCPTGLTCVDLWQKSECRCKKFYPPETSNVEHSNCLSSSCFKSPCQNGGVCTLVAGKVVCVCPRGYSGLSCEVGDGRKGGVTGRNFNLVAAIVLPILLALLLLCLLLFLLWWCCCRNRERGLLYDEPDKDIRENVIAYDDEGVGEEDNYAFDLERLQKSHLETENLKKSIDFNSIVPTFNAANKSAPGADGNKGLPGNYSNIADFISDRMNEVDADPDYLNDDTQTSFKLEGGGSRAGSLSTLASSEADRDDSLDWLENAGPKFGRLADMYGETERV